MRSPHHLVAARREYQRVVREAQETETPGLLQCAFLVENPVTWYSLSIWSEREAIARFGTTVQNLNWGDFDLRAAMLEAAE